MRRRSSLLLHGAGDSQLIPNLLSEVVGTFVLVSWSGQFFRRAWRARGPAVWDRISSGRWSGESAYRSGERPDMRSILRAISGPF